MFSVKMVGDICIGSQIWFCLIGKVYYFQSELVYFDNNFAHKLPILDLLGKDGLSWAKKSKPNLVDWFL